MFIFDEKISNDRWKWPFPNYLGLQCMMYNSAILAVLVHEFADLVELLFGQVA